MHFHSILTRSADATRCSLSLSSFLFHSPSFSLFHFLSSSLSLFSNFLLSLLFLSFFLFPFLFIFPLSLSSFLFSLPFSLPPYLSPSIFSSPPSLSFSFLVSSLSCFSHSALFLFFGTFFFHKDSKLKVFSSVDESKAEEARVCARLFVQHFKT
jgi:hypothetical protein